MNHDGLVLKQPERGYRYSLDPFLLADFCAPRRGERILDLGTGVGVIGLLLATRHPTVRVIGIELQPDLARYAAENARINALDGRFRIIRGDLRTAPRFLPPEHFHRVVANPPFRRPGSGATSSDPGRAGARQELTFTLTDLAETAAALLRFGGALCVIHLAERLPEILRALDAVRFRAQETSPDRPHTRLGPSALSCRGAQRRATRAERPAAAYPPQTRGGAVHPGSNSDDERHVARDRPQVPKNTCLTNSCDPAAFVLYSCARR